MEPRALYGSPGLLRYDPYALAEFVELAHRYPFASIAFLKRRPRDLFAAKAQSREMSSARVESCVSRGVGLRVRVAR